jgi:DnaJ like chaperone protein
MLKLLTILAAVLYGLYPLDLLPDYVMGWGWLDDIVVFLILWQVFSRLKQRFGDKTSGPSERKEGYRRPGPEPGANPTRPRPPHVVLGVPPDASIDEIKQAYRKLAGQYHPDKVSHLGEEFRQLAEIRFKEIQKAYQELSSQ